MRGLVALALIGCEPVALESEDSAFVDDGEPHVFITSPDAGADTDDCLTIGVDLYNFEVVSPVDEPTVVEGHGHYHVVFDARYIDCEADTCEVPLSSFEAGDVTILARLVGNDHADVLNTDGEQVEDSREFSYSGEACPEGEG
ncbi:hypothetical protein LBMAG42_33870 [Deltaproteobacteria bacterium]|nr:hypothetical protein LBMAG42_33870 [Deltaproteobacteria bacterium]